MIASPTAGGSQHIQLLGQIELRHLVPVKIWHLQLVTSPDRSMTGPLRVMAVVDVAQDADPCVHTNQPNVPSLGCCFCLRRPLVAVPDRPRTRTQIGRRTSSFTSPTKPYSSGKTSTYSASNASQQDVTVRPCRGLVAKPCLSCKVKPYRNCKDLPDL